MKIYEHLTRNPRTWFQGSYKHPAREAGCLMYHGDRLYGRKAFGQILPRLDEAITLLYSERVYLGLVNWEGLPLSLLARFNDHPDTTLEDVIRVCKVADV